jgi:hypothetical protein
MVFGRWSVRDRRIHCPKKAVISPYTVIRRERRLPVRGEVLVELGDRVEATDVLARGPKPGEFRLFDIARVLAVPDGEVSVHLRKETGDTIQAGEVIAARTGAIGFLSRTCRSPFDGSIIASKRGRVLMRPIPEEHNQTGVELPSLLRGQVSRVIPGYGAVIEAEAGLVEGAWGAGSEASGTLKVMVNAPDEPLSTAALDTESQGQILVGGTLGDRAPLLRAVEVKACGIVVGSMPAGLIESVSNLPLPVMVTEGFGQLPMADVAFELLKTYHGELACIGGHAGSNGAARPEVIVFPAARGEITMTDNDVVLLAGKTVRIVREPYMGAVGVVKAIPDKPTTVKSGLRLQVAEIELNSREIIQAPIANLECIR